MSQPAPETPAPPQSPPAAPQAAQIDFNALLRNPIVLLLLVGGGSGGVGSIWTMNQKQDRNIEEEIVTRMAVVDVQKRLDRLEDSVEDMRQMLYRQERASLTQDRTKDFSLRRDGTQTFPTP